METTNTNELTICSNCVMDTSDRKIIFDHEGICDHCNTYFNDILPKWNPEGLDDSVLYKLAEKIKKDGQGKDFDCIITYLNINIYNISF